MSERVPGNAVPNIETKIETKEELPQWRGIKVFRVRHGETEYKEHFGTLDEGDIDLTEKGQEQIKTAAECVASQLDPTRDLVYILPSLRKRTIDSAEIMREVLETKGIQMWNDPKDRDMTKFQSRITGADILNDEGEVVPTDHPQHQEFYEQALAEIDALMPEGRDGAGGIHKAWTEGEIAHLEDLEPIMERSRNQLAVLKRIAQRFTDSTERRIVIIQLEHTETLDELLEVATNGELGGRQGIEPQKGEVFELDIPAEGEEITIKPLSRGLEAVSIEYDHPERIFKATS